MTRNTSVHTKDAEKGFGRQENLKDHINVHTGETRAFLYPVLSPLLCKMKHYRFHLRLHNKK